MADMEMRGWWISPEGEVIPIPDHFKYILQNPERFGFAPDELAGIQWEPRGENRDKYMGIAFQEGWVRVREQKEFTIIQYWEKTDSVIGRIRDHLPEFGLTSQSLLAVSEVSNHYKFNITVESFLAPGNKQA